MITKKNVLIGSSVALILFFVSVYYYKLGLCSLYNHPCSVVFDTIGAGLLIFFPVLLCSLLTYRMHDSVFLQWMKFATWYVPIDMVISAIVFYSAASRIGGGFGGLIANALSVSIVLGLLAIFSIISLIIIAWKYFAQPTKH